jgi:Lrp/AsnC family transcriptional regulator for asnA, asnC and gidA
MPPRKTENHKSAKNGPANAGNARPLDRLDCEIIQILQKDGRLSNKEIGKTTGVSEATVRTRMNRLIQEGVIQIVAVSNPMKLGFGMVGNIRIHADVKQLDAVTETLKQLKPLWHIVHTTGESCIDCEFVARSLEELNDLIYNRIHKIDGILKTEVTLFMKYIKRRYDWGTALE